LEGGEYMHVSTIEIKTGLTCTGGILDMIALTYWNPVSDTQILKQKYFPHNTLSNSK
jgi:hypothetical protein